MPGVFLGSMLWWTLPVLMVKNPRGLVPPAALYWIAAATGLVLLGTGVWIGAKAMLRVPGEAAAET